MNTDMLLGKIKERRLTLNKVAHAIGISLSTFRRKIEGKTEFTREEINAVCKYLEIDNSELLTIFFDANVS